MANFIVIRMPDTEANKALVAGLIGSPGVIIETAEAKVFAKERKYMSMQETAEYLGVSYFTLRKWAIEDKIIPYERPSGKEAGIIRFRVEVVDEFMEGRLKKARRTKGGRIKLLN